ncbi:unnamed protein product [Natator depressus]
MVLHARSGRKLPAVRSTDSIYPGLLATVEHLLPIFSVHITGRIQRNLREMELDSGRLPAKPGGLATLGIGSGKLVWLSQHSQGLSAESQAQRVTLLVPTCSLCSRWQGVAESRL